MVEATVAPAAAHTKDDADFALDLGETAVGLLRREPLGWREVGRAPITPAGDLENAALLRRAAGARHGDPPPLVLVWLPAEQVLVRRLSLPASGDERREAALSDAAASTGQPAAELAVAIGPQGENGLSTVLATYRQSCREARAYAEGWGFAPVAVSTAVEAVAFGGCGPVFDEVGERPAADACEARGPTEQPDATIPTTAGASLAPQSDETPRANPPLVTDGPERSAGTSRASPPAKPKGVARTAALTAIAAAVIGVILTGLQWGPDRISEGIATSGPSRAMVAGTGFADGQGQSPRPADPASDDGPAGERWAALDLSSASDLAPPRDMRAPSLGSPKPADALPVPPRPDEGPAIALAPEAPGLPAMPPVRPDLGPLRVLPEEETPPPGPDAPGPDAPVTAESAARWKPARGGGDASVDDATPPLLVAEVARAPDAADEPPTARAPAEMTAPPRHRPESGDASAAEAVETPAASAGPEPATRVEEDAEAPAAGDEAAAATARETAPDLAPPPAAKDEVVAPPTAVAGQGDGPPAGEAGAVADAADGDAATGLAALAAPRPADRPKGLGAPIRPSSREKGSTSALPALPRLSRSAPQSVQRSAIEQGIPLDRAALIGILNVDTGRKALLRLPNGRYERLSVGETLEGWRVSTIGRDSVRLSRNGEERTLMLVNR